MIETNIEQTEPGKWLVQWTGHGLAGAYNVEGKSKPTCEGRVEDGRLTVVVNGVSVATFDLPE